ncbi:3-hydroxyisobutyrate dehydrogenase [Fusarium pseudoanthophilum]|uniref:3-hydroxyisobutyrate dehydrogenase n=1 Tax=Fusarium pseudoanthophilum TaxID=48495 RepID=A0A8H5L898_9HYPO|nr:3-hydroxyisobutyrate dehydrogenase [Fusarium pseudoanthophilum]
MSDLTDALQALEALEATAQGKASLCVVQGGSFTIDLSLFVDGVSMEKRSTVPCLCFIITYQASEGIKKRILYDLGICRDISSYPPRIQEQLPHHYPLEVFPDVKQRLLEGGLSPKDIDQIILSHMHWDHTGTPSDFPDATIWVGCGSLALLGGPPDTRNAHNNFSADLFGGLETKEFPDPSSWKVVGGLKVWDVTNQGFIYVVDSPGHLAGHISLLVRLGEKKWVLLIGDSCHDPRLLSGESAIAQWEDGDGVLCCVHGDREAAGQTLEAFRVWANAAVECGIDLDIIFAHDIEWAQHHPEAFLTNSL